MPLEKEIESPSEKSSLALLHSAQTPTRSLWLGNMDPAITAADLTLMLEGCGAIDNVRLIPDRECAFVNFVTIDGAIKAKANVVHQMSCRIGQQQVKVGFGRPEAVPQAAVCGSSGGEMNGSSQGPTRALWIGNIPVSTTSASLLAIFSPFGVIESARVLTHKNCGFVNFSQQEEAVRAKKALSGKEMMGPGTGAVRIGFAKEPAKLPPAVGASEIIATEADEMEKYAVWPGVSSNVSMEEYQAQMMMYMMAEMVGGHSSTIYAAVVAERQMIMREFGDSEREGPMLDELHMPIAYYASIAAAPELGHSRKIDIARLRDFRKKLESSYTSQNELEAIAMECAEEMVELCSDYIGNTIVQRLFERCSEATKSHLIEIVAPYLASVGVHKNGTWAAQKIIDASRLSSQINTVCVHLMPYVPALLLDQFGNYVVQCCLGLGPDKNQFIFDAIVDNCWEIAQGRFGSRAVRATLESPHVTKRQQKYVAAALIQNALLLSTNPNGALLLIWLLDTSGIPGRYSALAPRMAPHMACLCTHKLASLTVLKLINQRKEPEARTILLNTLFFSSSDALIDEVLQDQVHGVSLVQKILSSSYVELQERQHIAERVKRLLSKLKLHHVQGYKRLVEEINMVMRDSNPGASLGTVPGLVHSPFTLSPELTAVLHAKYMAAVATSHQAHHPPLPHALMATPHYSPPSDASSLAAAAEREQREEPASLADTPLVHPSPVVSSQALAAAMMANLYAAVNASFSSSSSPPSSHSQASDLLGILQPNSIDQFSHSIDPAFLPNDFAADEAVLLQKS
ncbi:armadillo-type protein [Spinellus fusiger]|nr:armadillo-type protein [Spinellus fusiger]